VRRVPAVTATSLAVMVGLVAVLTAIAAPRLAARLQPVVTPTATTGPATEEFARRLRRTALAWLVVGPLFTAYGYRLHDAWATIRAGESPSRRRSSLAVPIAALVAATCLVPHTRTGDEPSYLAVAQALARHGTTSVANPSLDYHRSPASPQGENRPIHSVGMSVLLAVPDLLLGDVGVHLASALVAVSLAYTLWRLLVVGPGASAGFLTVVVLTATFPMLTYGALALPEEAGALGFAVLYIETVRQRRPRLGSALAIAALPWLHVRFLPGAVWLLLVGFLAVRSRRRAVAMLVGPFAASVLAMTLLHLRWYGSASPFAMWGAGQVLTRYMNLLPGSLGLLVDEQYGLLAWAPLFLLMPLGLLALWRRSRGETLALGVLAAVTVGPALLLVWYGGWSPGGRFLVPLLAPLAVLAALGLEAALQGRRADRVLAGAILAAQFAIGAVCALLPDKVYGTMPEPARNYFLDLAQRLTHLDSRWILPAVAADGNRWPSVLHAAVLVAAWLAASALWWRRLDRHAMSQRVERS